MAKIEVRLSAEDEDSVWAEELRADSMAALQRAEDRLGLAIDRPPLIESIGPEESFYEAIGHRPHNLVAVARAHENRVIINRQVYLRQTTRSRRAVMVHEFTHLILGRRLPEGLPRWLDEGLAMVAAEEHSFRYQTRLAWAASFGGLIPLRDLAIDFGSGRGDQELAYAQSLSITRFLLESRSGRGMADDPRPLVRRLADPVEGRALRNLINDPTYLGALDRRWKASIRTVWTWIAVLGSAGVFWMAATWLFLFAYWRKRRRSREIEKRWEEEDDFPYVEDL